MSEVPVKPGDSVPAGAVLVRLDDTMARKKVDEAKAALESAKIARDRGRSLPEQHRLKLEQSQEAIDAAAAARQAAELELETAKTAATDQYRRAGGRGDRRRTAASGKRPGLKSARSELQQLKLVDPKTEMQALELQRDAGDSRSRGRRRPMLKQLHADRPQSRNGAADLGPRRRYGGRPPPAPAIQFCPAGPRVVKADVEQAFASLIAVGQRVTIEDDTHAAGSWTGRVRWVADWFSTQRPVLVPDPNQYSDVRTMPCIIELDPNQSPLKINQRVLATIDISRRAGGVSPPVRVQLTRGRPPAAHHSL